MTKDKLDGTCYHNHSDQQENWALALLENYPIAPNASVLDIGCGDGKISLYISQKVPDGKVLGIDPSPSMIEFAKKEYDSSKNLEFMLGSAEEVDFQDAFDLIVSFSTFHWVQDQKKAFKNILKALKKNGSLLIIAGTSIASPMIQAFQELYASKRWSFLKSEDSKFNGQSAEFYESLLKELKFSNSKVEVLQPMICFDSLPQLVEWIYAWIPLATGLEDEQAKAFAQDQVENIANQGFLAADGKISFPMPSVKITVG
ncbi:MAG: Trans-aconitate 2-methyltransferase [Chlamydiales bacterium]|nr:Trans-aconitate 2-methyltransferase [Chlamydiales bacterium]